MNYINETKTENQLTVWLPKIAIACKDDELWGCLYGNDPEFPTDFSQDDYVKIQLPEQFMKGLHDVKID